MTAPSIGCRAIITTCNPPIAVDATYQPQADWACYVGKLPDGPSKCIAFTDTGGLPSEPRLLLDYPTVSVMVRSSDYVSGYNKIKDIREAILGAPEQVQGGDQWMGIVAIGNMAFIGYDPKDRPMFSANFRLYVQPAASTVENRSVV
jgi:Bacteriophage minor capsid protein